jgi:hypothetical protein
MSDSSLQRHPDSPNQELTDRILARVRDAGLAVDQRPGAQPRRRRGRPAAPDPLAADATRTPEQVREARALRRVFLELGDCYRGYRLRTGSSVSPEVRDAAYGFRRKLDLPSLVLVAASLERLDALTW